jgi:hypothetical protein
MVSTIINLMNKHKETGFHTLILSLQIATTCPPTLRIKSLLNGERDTADTGPSCSSPHDLNLSATRKIIVNKFRVLN